MYIGIRTRIPLLSKQLQIRTTSTLTTTTTTTTASIVDSRPTIKMTNYKIEITSDIICPWCYIGHTRLTRAIEAHKRKYPDDTFRLTYIPFYLNPPEPGASRSTPTFPVKSTPRHEAYASKFGAQRAQQIFGMLSQVSRSEGLDFKFGGRTGSSRNGHRLIHFAQQQDQKSVEEKNENAQNATMLGLWRRYFEQEIDITDLKVLVDVGVEARLGSAEEVEEFLTSGRDTDEVDRLAEEARGQGIQGVPFYVVQDQWVVEGAQGSVAFEKLFEKWKSIEQKETTSKNDVTGGGGGAVVTNAGKLDKADAC